MNVALLFSVAGFIFNLILLGLVVEKIREVMLWCQGLHDRIVARNHAVILGWTDQTLFLLGELAQMYAERGTTYMSFWNVFQVLLNTSIVVFVGAAWIHATRP